MPGVSPKTLLLYVVASFAAISLVGLGYDRIYAFAHHSDLQAQPTIVLIGKAKDASAWQAYLTIALLLPVAEEIMFRGYLFDALRKYFSGWIVILLTAAEFSLVHFQPLYFFPLFGIGVVLGWLRMKTGSLTLPVFVHVANNAFALAFTG